MASAPNASSEGDEDSKSKLRQAQRVAGAIEQGLKEQRDQLQLQLDLSAQREALLEARISQLQERMVLEEAVWLELKSNPRTSPEALALKLRRAREALRWAERAEADERQQRMAAEALVIRVLVQFKAAHTMKDEGPVGYSSKRPMEQLSHSSSHRVSERADSRHERGSHDKSRLRDEGRKRLESALKNFQVGLSSPQQIPLTR
eukprot:336300-Hanusia_phi.AAC.3